jgi:hypothetical protein
VLVVVGGGLVVVVVVAGGGATVGVVVVVTGFVAVGGGAFPPTVVVAGVTVVPAGVVECAAGVTAGPRVEFNSAPKLSGVLRLASCRPPNAGFTDAPYGFPGAAVEGAIAGSGAKAIADGSGAAAFALIDPPEPPFEASVSFCRNPTKTSPKTLQSVTKLTVTASARRVLAQRHTELR